MLPYAVVFIRIFFFSRGLRRHINGFDEKNISGYLIFFTNFVTINICLDPDPD